jgi:hypothetical protein
MAEIATYRCPDDKCRFVVRLSKDFPVWHQETPRHLRTLAVSPAAAEYVIGYRSESYCVDCRQVVNASADGSCAKCNGTNAFAEQSNRTCPQCLRGTLFIEDLKIR